MKNFLNMLFGALVLLVAAELVVRCLPASYGFASPPPSERDPVIHYEPGASYRSSAGWTMRNEVGGRFNRLGFSSAEVDPGPGSTLLVGDSFVDALMIPPGQRIGDQLEPAGSIKQAVVMGVAGADLPDYMVTAHWAAQKLPIATIVFLISKDDLEGSIRPKMRGYWYVPGPKGLEVRRRADMRIRNLIGQSRLGSYLIYNLKFAPRNIIEALTKRDVAPPPGREALSAPMVAAAKRFIADAARLQHQGTRILLVFQGDHNAIYGGRMSDRPAARLLVLLAAGAKLSTLDLDPVFRIAFARTGRRLDLGVSDDHWNVEGHRLAAYAIKGSLDRGPGVRAPGEMMLGSGLITTM